MGLKLCDSTNMIARLSKVNQDIRQVGLGAFIEEKENTTWHSNTRSPERFQAGDFC